MTLDTELDWTGLVAEPAPSFPLSMLESIVLNIFKARGGMNDTALCEHYELIWHTQGWPQVRLETPRKRRSALTAKGLLVDSGEKRDNGYGREETVWVLAS